MLKKQLHFLHIKIIGLLFLRNITLIFPLMPGLEADALVE